MRPVGPVGAQRRGGRRLAGQGARRRERGETRRGRHDILGRTGELRAGDGKGGNICGGRARGSGRAGGGARAGGIGG